MEPRVQLQRTKSDHQVSDVRKRSTRNLCKPVSLDEQARMMIDFVNGDDSKLPLSVNEMSGKGKGIVTTDIIPKDTFVVEYVGDLITGKKAKELEKEYSTTNVGSFMFFFKYEERSFCIDATENSQRLGRLINHSIANANIKPKVIFHKNSPRIVFFSTRIIGKGEELSYPYGDQSKESLKNFPFLRH